MTWTIKARGGGGRLDAARRIAGAMRLGPTVALATAEIATTASGIVCADWDEDAVVRVAAALEAAGYTVALEKAVTWSKV